MKRGGGQGGYSFVDTAINSPFNYYRLRIIDTLNNTTFSHIILVEGSVVNMGTVKIHPNPAVDYVLMDHPSSNTSSNIILTDARGKTLRIVQVLPNTTQTRVDLSGPFKGLYYIFWTDGTRKQARTIVIRPN